MTRLLTTIIAMLLTAFGALAQSTKTDTVPSASHLAQYAKGIKYGFSFLNGQKMPDMEKFLPGPPSEKDALYKNDVAMYKWGKAQRGTLRCDTAVWDNNVDIEYYMKRMGWAIGKEITPTNCPNLATLLRGAMQDIRGGMQHAKEAHMRHRPYQVFKESTPLPEDEHPDDYTSYPSGHAVRAWALAMIFVALDPADEDIIMKTGYELGQSRIIVGYHFQSDIDPSRLYASAGFARLCAEPTFWAYLQLARKELEALH